MTLSERFSAAEPITNYEAAVAWLMGSLNYERTPARTLDADGFRLERMRRLLDLAGNPHRIPAVHVAGTKGKGSTATMIAAMLTVSGFRTGLFTSPHLYRIEERFRVDGELISESQFTALTRQVRQITERVTTGDAPFQPTFFELTTLLAWLTFREANCERVVLEVGLGGRLDTTNLCEPLATLITSISRDHTELLGETLAEIATEKAGILKPNVPLFTAVDDTDALNAIRTVADRVGAPMFVLGEQLHADSPSETELRVRTPFDGETPSVTHPVPLAGSHQHANATLAITALRYLSQGDDRITERTIRHGLESVRLPLRIEVVRQGQPIAIVDAAHNSASAKMLSETVRSSYPERRRLLIFGSSRDKLIDEILDGLADAFDEVILTRYRTNPRAIPASELQPLASRHWGDAVTLTDSPEEAWRVASERIADGPDDRPALVCTTGSFFLAAEMRELLLSESNSPSARTPQPETL